MASFGLWDYVILAVVLLISAAIGIYYRLTGGKQKTTEEFLLGDRSMSIMPVAFSLMASFMSAVTLLGVSMENYQYGTQFVLINVSYILSTPVAAYLILPVFYRLKTASVYEYLDLRFGYPTRFLASLAFSLQMILYMGIVLYAPALALEAVTGLDQSFSILIIGIVCTFYSTLGGLKAVLLTDIFQSVLMFVAVFSVIICAALKADGGLSEIWQTAREGGRLQFWNFSVDPTTRHTVWTQIIGGGATYLSLYGVSQTQVQRLMSVRNLKSSQAALWWSMPILMALSLSTCFSGLCMYYYYRNCDPLLEGRITSRDQLMPLFVVDTMSDIPGISGLFVSGIFSASLSTISATISSLAAVTLEDYIKPLVMHCSQKSLSEKQTIFYSKFLSLVHGLLCVAIAFLAKSLGGVLQASLSIFGVVGGPLLGLFTLGMYITGANQKGVITGLLVGLAFSFWIGFGQPKPSVPVLPMSTEGCLETSDKTPTSHVSDIFYNLDKSDESVPPSPPHYFYLYRISYMWYAVLGFICTFLVGIVSSWIYEKLGWDSTAHIYADATTRTQINHDLFVPPIAKRLRLQQVPEVVITGISSATLSTNDEEIQTNKTTSTMTINSVEVNERVDQKDKEKYVQSSTE